MVTVINHAGPSDRMIMENPAGDKVKDKYFTTYLLFYTFGTVFGMPNNFFTTATEYWLYKFRDVNQPFNVKNRTDLQTQFTSSYSIVSNASTVVFLIVTILLIKKIPLFARITGSLCIIIFVFTFTSIFVLVDTDTWQKGFFGLTLASGVVLCTGSTAFIVSLFQLVSKFPHNYLPAVLSGQSICGILAALVQIFSLSVGASYTITGLIYFLIALFFIFFTLCIFLYHNYKSEFYLYYLNKKSDTSERPKVSPQALLAVLNKVKFYLAAMAINLGSTVMTHPALTSLVVSLDEGTKWGDSYFVPVCTFLLFNLFDYFGRECSLLAKWPKNDIALFIISILRITMVPLIMLCNLQSRSHLPVVFNNDYSYIILIIIFAFTNGFFVNLSVILLPTKTEEEERTILSVVILIVMIIALGACSFISAALVKAL